MTIIEALEATSNVLNDISVPIGLRKQIADPIELALKNISEIIKAIRNAETPKDTADDQPAVSPDQI